MPVLGEDPKVTRGIQDKKIKEGLVFGKFMPPTKGHLFLIEHARQSCENLTIMVCSLPDEPIKGELRYQWVKSLFPDCNVVHHSIPIQQEPKTSADDPTGVKDIAFFEAWRDTIKHHCPNTDFDALFASESYGFRVADIMGVRFIPVDVDRKIVPISGTKVRNNPLKNWDYLPDVVKPYFLKKVAVVDFSDHHTHADRLANRLAKEFNTLAVGSYLEMYLDLCEKQMPNYRAQYFDPSEIATILRGQIANENALAKQANRFLFTAAPLPRLAKKLQDTFSLTHTISTFDEAQNISAYDYYVLVKPQKSGLSETEYKQSKQSFKTLQKKLDDKGIPYKIVPSKNAKRQAKNGIRKAFLC